MSLWFPLFCTAFDGYCDVTVKKSLTTSFFKIVIFIYYLYPSTVRDKMNMKPHKYYYSTTS